MFQLFFSFFFFAPASSLKPFRDFDWNDRGGLNGNNAVAESREWATNKSASWVGSRSFFSFLLTSMTFLFVHFCWTLLTWLWSSFAMPFATLTKRLFSTSLCLLSRGEKKCSFWVQKDVRDFFEQTGQLMCVKKDVALARRQKSRPTRSFFMCTQEKASRKKRVESDCQ